MLRVVSATTIAQTRLALWNRWQIAADLKAIAYGLGAALLGYAGAEALLATGVLAGVQQAFNRKVAACTGLDLVGSDDCAP